MPFAPEADTVFMPDVRIFGDDQATFVAWEAIDTSYMDWISEAYGGTQPIFKLPPRKLAMRYKANGYNWNLEDVLNPATVGYQAAFSPIIASRSRVNYTSWRYDIKFVTASMLNTDGYNPLEFMKTHQILISPASSPLSNEEALSSNIMMEVTSSIASSFDGIGARLILPKDAVVDVKVLDVAGRTVRHLGPVRYSAGTHEIRFHGDNKPLPGGIYFLRAKVDDRVLTRKFMVVR